MGKRKERRLAAISNAGRRVKLDLFAEPSSGDLVGSSVNGEVGEDINPIQQSQLPESPSSSGEQPDNSLLLLGQYSDDDLDEKSNEPHNQASSENSPADHEQQEELIGDGGDADGNALADLADQGAISQGVERDSTPLDALQNLEGVSPREGDQTSSKDASEEMERAEDISVASTSTAQVIGDVSMGWKVVLHEESNQYYYWNIETGETSWDVPDVLSRTTELSLDQKPSGMEDLNIVTVQNSEPCSTLGVSLDGSSVIDGSVDTNLASQNVDTQVTHQQNELFEEQKSESLKDKSCMTNVDQCESLQALNAVNTINGDGSEYVNYMVASDNQKEETDCSMSLINQCESLLERLKSLKEFQSFPQPLDWMSKCIIELQIRLSDMKSLASYGSSLLPFWVHSDWQLKQLEDLINKEIYNLAVSAQMDDEDEEDLPTVSSSKEKDGSVGGERLDSRKFDNENSIIAEDSLPAANEVNSSPKTANIDDMNASPPSSLVSRTQLSEGGPVSSHELNVIAEMKHDYSGEDVDMDVDMEVEDTIPVATVNAGCTSAAESFSAAKQLIQTDLPVENPSLPQGDLLFVPPPPDDEWIPPPPPDNEQVPPPPPESEQVPLPPSEEPHESSYPSLPSQSEMGQPFQYTHSYNLSYADPNYQYYETAVTIPSSDLFSHSDATQAGVPDPSLYYGAVSHTYAETASVAVPVVPVAYYDLQDGSMSSISAVVSADAPMLHAAMVATSYSANAFGAIASIDNSAESVSSLKLDVSVRGDETALASAEVPTTSVSSQDRDNLNGTKESDPASLDGTSATVTALSAPAATVKVQSKALRSKRRTLAVAPSLRSNKKVSSLVDKWKAAKEELLDSEEDEPENAYEMLEKKRRREIEEWKAKQIANGEAKDNANFQPLGGDWRERVKRRRAQSSKESEQTQPKEPVSENHHPDLAELSKGLPTGWQIYWDEASKQVYYGNTRTQETTWTRPTK